MITRISAGRGRCEEGRAKVLEMSRNGGPGVKRAASEAIDAGTTAALPAFLEKGQYTAREEDDRVEEAAAKARSAAVEAAGHAQDAEDSAAKTAGFALDASHSTDDAEASAVAADKGFETFAGSENQGKDYSHANISKKGYVTH
ncbi:ALF repeat-containing protein [Streptomyces californicus]|uniref:ALF repeat-containing protein n=1 Tax=Streptomyces californicus TaxID=67351 RepID=UPI0037A63D84